MALFNGADAALKKRVVPNGDRGNTRRQMRKYGAFSRRRRGA
jgi:hypothetical protein